MPWSFAGFCTQAKQAELRGFLEPRIASLPGGPRNLRGTLEAIQLCTARREALHDGVRTFLSAAH